MQWLFCFQHFAGNPCNGSTDQRWMINGFLAQKDMEKRRGWPSKLLYSCCKKKHMFSSIKNSIFTAKSWSIPNFPIVRLVTSHYISQLIPFNSVKSHWITISHYEIPIIFLVFDDKLPFLADFLEHPQPPTRPLGACRHGGRLGGGFFSVAIGGGSGAIRRASRGDFPNVYIYIICIYAWRFPKSWGYQSSQIKAV